MIIEALLNLIFGLLKLVFGWLELPAFPEALTSSINQFFDLIFQNLTLLGFFIRPSTITICVPVLILIINFERIYKFTMWLLRKIPFINIQ